MAAMTKHLAGERGVFLVPMPVVVAGWGNESQEARWDAYQLAEAMPERQHRHIACVSLKTLI
jgi:hypothetical protein